MVKVWATVKHGSALEGPSSHPWCCVQSMSPVQYFGALGSVSAHEWEAISELPSTASGLVADELMHDDESIKSIQCPPQEILKKTHVFTGFNRYRKCSE